MIPPRSAPASAAESAVDPLDGGAARPPSADPLDATDRWERRGELAAGGMGVVTIVHDRFLGRDIAVKVPGSPEDAARLLFEARVTASLDHPGIVSVFDAGRSATDTPWFAMRLVRGRSLADALAELEPASPATPLLRHVLAAAEAVGYAHAHGVIHRDLKPANIMVGPFGETQVIDWGLALVAGVASPDPGRAGTAAAMSPEQARRESLDPRTDVYALGMILFEVVARRAPFPASLGREAILEALAADRVPVLPAHGVAPELRAIIACATSAAPAARYPDAKALADDLARYLEGRRVAAHTYSAREIFARLVRLWRVPIGLGLVALALVVATLVVAFAEIAAERDAAERTLGRTLVANARAALRHDDRGAAEVLAREALARGDFPEARGVLLALPRARPERASQPLSDCAAADVAWPDGADGEVRVLCLDRGRVAVRRGGAPWWERALGATAATFIARGEVVLVQLGGQRLERLDARTGAPLGGLEAPCSYARFEATPDRTGALLQHHACAAVVDASGVRPMPVAGCVDGVLRVANLSLDGATWAGTCGDGSLVIGPASGPTRRIDARLPASPSRPLATALAIAAEGGVLVGDSDGGVSHIPLDHPEAKRRLVLHDALVRRIVLAPDRQRALVRYEDGPVYVLDLARWASLGRLPPRAGVGYHAVGFTPDGAVYAASDGQLERWDFAAVPNRELTFAEGITDLALAADGTTLAVGHGATLSVVDVASRRVATVHRWQPELVRTFAFAGDGRGASPALLVGTLGDLALRRFEARGEPVALPWDRYARKVVAVGRGAFLVSDFGRRLWRFEATGPPRPGPDVLTQDHDASPDGRHLAVLDVDQRVWVASDWAPGQPLLAVATLADARRVARCDAGHVFVLDRDGVRELSATAADTEVLRYRGSGAELGALVVSPRVVAAGARDGSIVLWRRGAPEPTAVVRDHERRVDELALDPDGRWLAAGDWNGRLLFVDTELAPGADARAPSAWGLALEDLLGQP